MTPDGGNEGSANNPVPKDWVRRLVQAQGVVVEERQLGWWTFHLESFLRYCRRRGEQVEVKLLARGFLDELSASAPPVASLRVEQTRQALTVFVRGIEHWHWEPAEGGEWAPHFRVKPPAEAGATPAERPTSTTHAEVDRTSWEGALRTALRVRHYALRTEQTYTQWARQFLGFHPATPLRELDAAHVRRFLEHLAVGRNVTATTQNQALSALLFLFQYVLGRELGELGETVRGKRGRKLPVVLSRDEVRRLLAATEGTGALMLRLMYGGGLRLMECLRLRVKDVDLERELVNVRSGKGNKDRTVPLPRSLQAELARHRERLRVLHEADRRENLPGVWMPDALGVKYPNAGTELAWQWFFPSRGVSVDPRTGLRRRHHLHDNSMHLIVKAAARLAGVDKHVSCHTLRHSFATHLVEDGVDLRSIQELLGHNSVETTEIYTHVATPAARRVHSPLDTLGAGPLGALLPSPKTREA